MLRANLLQPLSNEKAIKERQDLIEILPKVLNDFNLLNLDILLLGYLTPFIVNDKMSETGFSLKRQTDIKPIYTYHNYPEELMGTQMYILSRKHAKTLLDKYYNNSDEELELISDSIFLSFE